MEEDGNLGKTATGKSMEANKIEEIDDSSKFNDMAELLKYIDKIDDEFAYIHKEELFRWINGEDFICVPAVY